MKKKMCSFNTINSLIKSKLIMIINFKYITPSETGIIHIKGDNLVNTVFLFYKYDTYF